MPKAKNSRTRACYVYLQLPGSTDVVTCGQFEHTEITSKEGVGRFLYGRSYLARPEAVPLDPYNLPLREGWVETAQQEGVFGAIRDAAPDRWGNIIIERALGRTDLTILDYLLHSPEDRAGALSFGQGVVPPAPTRPFNRVIQLAELLEAAATIEAMESGSSDAILPGEQLLHLFEQTSIGMGGARPKNSVEDEEGLWIAKFPSQRDRWQNAAVEATMLALAELCGIRVPFFRIEQIGTRAVLLIKRFDRARASPADVSQHAYLRSRMVSALTVLNMDEDDRNRWSYVLLADELQRWSESPREDKRELFRRMVFNALISNDDDHPRNHALVAPGPNFRLSPAYDLTPSRSQALERNLAMIAGTRGRQATRLNLLSQVERFATTRHEGEAIIDEMKQIITQEWEPQLWRHGGRQGDVDAIRHAFVYPGFEYDPESE